LVGLLIELDVVVIQIHSLVTMRRMRMRMRAPLQTMMAQHEVRQHLLAKEMKMMMQLLVVV
jgi:hypothetical protein